MKIRLLAAMLLVTGFASAQMGMNGRNRGGLQSQMNQPQQTTPDKGPSPDEQLNNFMQKITPELELNGLQEAAVRNIYKDQMTAMANLKAASALSDAEKQEEARVISERTDKDVKALLDVKQLEKYDVMKKNLREGKRIKKKKNKKDEEEKSETVE
ncbi:MAG: hypothetical protein EOP06_23080 [Proteobacteria bacterium]|nr:MAG: hypothetical protein EOP06_23080 [Pseudomonadota bacterium]